MYVCMYACMYVCVEPDPDNCEAHMPADILQ